MLEHQLCLSVPDDVTMQTITSSIWKAPPCTFPCSVSAGALEVYAPFVEINAMGVVGFTALSCLIRGCSRLFRQWEKSILDSELMHDPHTHDHSS